MDADPGAAMITPQPRDARLSRSDLRSGSQGRGRRRRMIAPRSALNLAPAKVGAPLRVQELAYLFSGIHCTASW